MGLGKMDSVECCLDKNYSGYKGECCCNCEHQLEISTCSCPSCSKVEGYICLMYHVVDNSYKCSHSYSKHGLCEMWTKKKNQ